MSVVFHRKRLEPALVQMARAFGVMVRMPPHGVRVRQPTKKGRELGVCLRPDHKMPVIGHHSVGKNGQRLPLDRLDRKSVV